MGYAFRLAKTVLSLALGIGFFTIVGGLIYLNQVGFPGQYGDWVCNELSNRGLHLNFSSMRFDPNRGLVATDVKFYAEHGDSVPILKAKEVTLDLDKTKALRGKFKLISLIIIDGSTLVPTEMEDETLEAANINGRITMSDSGRLRFHDASGLIEGIQVSIKADVKPPKPREKKQEPGKKREPGPANKILHLVLEEMAKWEIPEDSPPVLDFIIRGDLNQPDRISTEFSLTARNLKRNDYALKKLKITGDLRAQLVTLDTIFLEDETGHASGQSDWSLTRREGRFNLDSSLQFQHFLQSCFGIEVLPRLKMPQSPVISVSGRFAAPEGEKFSVQASGSGHLGNFLFLETPYEELGADFSWNDGDLYLRDLVVKHDHGQLEGDVLSRGNTIKYDLTSTLPLSAFDPFITSGSKTELELAKVKFRDNSTLNLDIEGELDHSDLTTWTSSGKAHLSNFTYRDTDLHHLKTEFEIKQGQQSFTKVKCLVNDNKEIARTRFGGNPSKELNVDSILVDRNERQVVVSNLRGELWPTPIIRIFAPAASRHLENNYRFHEPPNVTLNGSFSTKKGDNTKNAYSVRITTKGQTDYPFLGKPLPTTNLKADVTIKRSQVTVDNIFFNTLDGTAAGKVIIDTKRGGPNSYRGTMKWNRLYFPKISQVYQFKEKEKGWLTGLRNSLWKSAINKIP